MTDTVTPVIPRWRGLNRNGDPRSGALNSAADVAAMVERSYDQGWRSLSVTRGDVEVGGIDIHPLTHQRVWWAEA